MSERADGGKARRSLYSAAGFMPSLFEVDDVLVIGTDFIDPHSGSSPLDGLVAGSPIQRQLRTFFLLRPACGHGQNREPHLKILGE